MRLGLDRGAAVSILSGEQAPQGAASESDEQGMWRERAARAAGVLVLAGLGALLHHGAQAPRAAAVEGLPLEYLPSASSARWLSLGHTAALADVFWIRGVLYYTGEARNLGRFAWVRQYIELVVALDPGFVDIYRWAGTALLVAEGEVGMPQIELANHFLEQGAARFPDNWRLPMTAMANCSYYLQTQDPEEQAALKACRLKFLRMAAYRPGAPYTLALMLAGEEGAGADDPAAKQRLCQMLMEVYLQSRQPELKAQLQARARGGACGAMSPDEVEVLERRFDTAHQRSYPYLSPDLFVQVVDTQRAEDDRAVSRAAPRPSEP